jgi:thiosulfate dehydrogenase [quinone] large subunit
MKGDGMGRWIESFPRTSLAWLAFIRIGVGLVFLTQSIDKLLVKPRGPQDQTMGNWLTDPERLRGILTGAARGTDPIYAAFLQGVAIPNAGVFSYLITIGELLVAVSLILGLLTRLGGFAGAFIMLNTMWMKGFLANGGWTDRLMLLLVLVMAFTAAGYVLGLDGVLRGRAPGWLRALMSKPPDPEDLPAPARERTVQPA